MVVDIKPVDHYAGPGRHPQPITVPQLVGALPLAG
jgi:hypothetical protein